MPRTVTCRKLGRELPGLPFKPFAAQAFMRTQMAVYFGFEQGDMATTAWTPEAPKP
jgi:hypothetical protein